MRLIAASCSIILLASCGAGTGSSSGNFAQAAGEGFAAFLLVDARTGAVTTRDRLLDLADNPEYRSSQIVFRRIAPGSATLGTSQFETYREADEQQRHGSRAVQEHFMAVFELTAGQFAILSQSGSVSGSNLPLSSTTAFAVDEQLAKFHERTGVRLRLPTADEWEHDCRAGSAGLFSWGDSTENVDANRYACTAQSTAVAPIAVGTREPNALGLYDMHGNVWELTSNQSDEAEGQRLICGGSWLDPLLQSRCANRAPFPANVAHPLVGVRLVLDR